MARRNEGLRRRRRISLEVDQPGPITNVQIAAQQQSHAKQRKFSIVGDNFLGCAFSSAVHSEVQRRPVANSHRMSQSIWVRSPRGAHRFAQCPSQKVVAGFWLDGGNSLR